MSRVELSALDIEDLKKARDRISLEDSIVTISNAIGGLSKIRNKPRKVSVDLPRSERGKVNNLVSKIKKIKESNKYKHNKSSPILNKVEGKLKDLITKYAKPANSKLS